ncbi:MAG: hypothetical protein M1617_07190 [Actinobacteria bacterium]|nr:hypothetical protein [Actinomycetota bacterium]MCL5888053.1 hypothetical protein [Actinomycetota bacterium]
MQVTLAVLADWAATTDQGKLVIAGVFETINAPALPATHPMMALALRLAADPGESSNHRLTLRLVDPDGDEVIPALDGDISFGEIHPQEGGRAQVILNMPGVLFSKAGAHSLEVLVDGRLEHSIDLFVRLTPLSDEGLSGHQLH